ncbi:MAG: histidine phosphatase family protein [Nocardioidaceae bacterium]|nr:histidine phosphatase family protein [Nocardioidaceae bacterium]
MRHGKAEQFAASDHERRLTERGVADATEAGRWVRAHDKLPDHALVSSAQRTLGTWAAFADGAGCDLEPVVDRALYSAGTDAALEILRTVPADAARVIVIGHNPTMAYLVHLLDDGGADPEVFAEVSAGYPTSALAVLEVESPWDQLDVAGARIAAFHVGRG